MTGKERSGVFLSYARADGEDFAASLRERLGKQAPDIVIKQDRILLEGGVGWWKQLTEAIDSVEFLILVMTPSSMQSETVRKEWRYARQQGVCVYPVKGVQDLHFAELPRWMKKAHFFDLDREWESFIAHLRKGCDSPRVPFMAPDLPENFVQREDEFRQLKDLLLSVDRKEPIAITTALSGAGGFGKTTLASALCHDEDIIQNFDDGILWVTLGQNPNVMNGLVTVYAALTGDRPGFASEEDAAFQLGQKLEDRTCLFVIDDVWDESHLRPFLRGGKGSARLFTTRNAEIASSKSQPVRVDEMRGRESQELLAKGVPGLDSSLARELAKRLGEWPLAIEIASAMIKQRIRLGDSPENAAQSLLDTLQTEGPSGLEKGVGDLRHRNIESVLQGSLEMLGEDRPRLLELSIFPEDISIPLTAAAALWGLSKSRAEKMAQQLARHYLVTLDLARGSIRLHDFTRSWLANATENSAELHSRLADSWSDWTQLPDAYAWRWLTLHLARAGRQEEIETLICNPMWLQEKFRATDLNALIGDFEFLNPSPEAEMIRGALLLSSHIIAKDPSQFASQLVGRLLPHQDRHAIREFVATLTAGARRPWLRPFTSALDTPGGSLIRTLEGHSNRVTAVAMTLDGRSAVSASADKTLRVWDLESGREQLQLEGHSDEVTGVAIAPDGQRAVSASRDKTLKVWDLESGRQLLTCQGHSDWVRNVAISSNGKWFVSASDDKTIKIWDLATGHELHTLEGHGGWIRGVAITSNDRYVVSASDDGTLNIWGIQATCERVTLDGHLGSVNAVAVTPDGRHVVSASMDKKLKIWELERGRELKTLESHFDVVRGLAIAPDGRRVICGSVDNTIKIWDLEDGQQLATLFGHFAQINGVAIGSNGRRAISASDDGTLKLWDLETGRRSRNLENDTHFVKEIAIASDCGRAVSVSSRGTATIWDMGTGAELNTIKLQLSAYEPQHYRVATTSGGWRAISDASDNVLDVWDLETGRIVSTLAFEPSEMRLRPFYSGVAITLDGRRAVIACDQEMALWDLEMRKRLRKVKTQSPWPDQIAVSPDGWFVAASGFNFLELWDLRTDSKARNLQGHSANINDVVISHDGLKVISASDDDTIKIWDIATGRELRTLEAHSGGVRRIAISSDGRWMTSASRDNTLKVWDLATSAPVATFTCDAPPTRCAICDDGRVVTSDFRGRMHFLSLEFDPYSC